MEHRISLSISLAQGSMRDCTVVECDSRFEPEDQPAMLGAYESGSKQLSPIFPPRPPSAVPAPPVPAITKAACPQEIPFPCPCPHPIDSRLSTRPDLAGPPELGFGAPDGPFRLTTSPRWHRHARTTTLFFWGFIFPPLWICGAACLFPPCRRRLTRSARPAGVRGPRIRQLMGGVPRIRTKGEVGLGTTVVVVVPRQDAPERLGEQGADHDWSPNCASPAERLDAAEIASSLWLQPGEAADAEAEEDKRERRGAFHCLLALFVVGLVVAVVVAVGRKVYWPGHKQLRVHSALDNGPNMANNNLLGASTHSSPL